MIIKDQKYGNNIWEVIVVLFICFIIKIYLDLFMQIKRLDFIHKYQNKKLYQI